MIHKAKDLSPDEKTLVEGLLGRPFSEDEAFIIRTVDTASAPDWLQASWDSARQSGVDQITPAEIEAEIAAARQDRRNGTQPSRQ
jgi:hypothetical protein